MNYADLFRATLPETALEIAALLVLVVDSSVSAQSRATWVRNTPRQLLLHRNHRMRHCGLVHAARLSGF